MAFVPLARGRHAEAYHEWAYKQVEQIASEAKDQKEFLELFEKRVKSPVRANPNMLYKDYWRRDG